MAMNSFRPKPFDPEQLRAAIPYLRNSETVQQDINTLTCRIDRGGPVLVSYFGALRIRQIHEPSLAAGAKIAIASLADLAGTKAAVIQKRAEPKDYIDIDVLLRNNFELTDILKAGQTIYGPSFNPTLTLKALAYFDDVPDLAPAIQKRLAAAVKAVNPAQLVQKPKSSKGPQP
jgi:Nucleotidyl transferase AbiEii toxin, Type IV TA system